MEKLLCLSPKEHQKNKIQKQIRPNLMPSNDEREKKKQTISEAPALHNARGERMSNFWKVSKEQILKANPITSNAIQ
jgi:hypothetical protein